MLEGGKETRVYAIVAESEVVLRVESRRCSVVDEFIRSFLTGL